MNITNIPYQLRGADGELIPVVHVEGKDNNGARIVRDIPLDKVTTPEDLLRIMSETEPVKATTDDERRDMLPVTSQKDFIDRDTGTEINDAVHCVSGTNESIGILRDQLVQIINTLGLSPTNDFTRLNDIAIVEIEKGQIAKEALTDA